MNPEYGQVFTSFGGSDFIVTLNGKMLPEACAIHWEEEFLTSDPYEVKGYVDLGIYESSGESESFLRHWAKQMDPLKLAIDYQLETGYKKSIRIHDVILLKRSSTSSVDDVSLTQRYYFKAKKVFIFNIDKIEAFSNKPTPLTT